MKWPSTWKPWQSSSEKNTNEQNSEAEEEKAREALRLLFYPSQRLPLPHGTDVAPSSSPPPVSPSPSTHRSFWKKGKKEEEEKKKEEILGWGEVEKDPLSKGSPSLLPRTAPTGASLRLNAKGYRRHEKTEVDGTSFPSPPLLPAATSSPFPLRPSLEHEKGNGLPTTMPALIPSIVPWPQLPPCPIPGFYVTEEGVWEANVSKHESISPVPLPPPAGGDAGKNPTDHPDPNGRTTLGTVPPSTSSYGRVAAPAPSSSSVLLTREAFRERIRQLQRVEQEAKKEVDDQLPDLVRMRSLRGLEVVVNSLLLGVGVYWMTWKSAVLYQGAIPRQSLFFTQVLALLRHFPTSSTTREDMARRHRRWLQATNANVTGSFLVGLFLTSFAWYTRPDFTSLDDAPEAKKSQETVWCRNVSNAGLKWMWFLYFHHPAYAKASGGGGAIHCSPQGGKSSS